MDPHYHKMCLKHILIALKDSQILKLIGNIRLQKWFTIMMIWLLVRVYESLMISFSKALKYKLLLTIQQLQ